jgi:diguanylate cyclase (GGDEF)-like protein
VGIDEEAAAQLVAAIPLPAVIVDGGAVVVHNDEATTLFGAPPDLLAGAFDAPSRDRLRQLVEGSASAANVPLRWGERPPYTWLDARARRQDDGSTLVVFVDETEAHRLDGVLTALDNAVFGMDAGLRIQWMSRGMVSAYGVPYPLGSEPVSRMHPDDIPLARKVFADALASPRRRIHATARASSADFPDVFWQLDYSVVNLLDDPAVGAVVSTFGPHAAAPGEEDSPHDVATNVNRMSDIMPAGIVQATADSVCYYRNRLAEQQLGGVAYGDPAHTWIDRAREEDREPLQRALKEATAGHRSDPVVAGYGSGPSPGAMRWLRIEFTPQYDQTGAPSGWVATSLDITAEVEARDELHRAQQHLWELANHDALTGLPNRPAILDRINAALIRAQREPHPVALLFCDLDGFKPVNDEHGHEAGDQVLRIVAGRMQGAVRASDTVGRLGGDEFVILCEEFSTEDDVLDVADRVRAQVRAPMGLAEGDTAARVALDVTIGVAIAGPHETSATLLARADRSMYDAKPHRR